ncbi:hypothetical protein PS6_002114 [Mucor atramentarius]
MMQQSNHDVENQKPPLKRLYLIIASNTPLIATEFNGFGLYGWVNTAFLLTASTSQPLYGRCADMFGRRICFLFATASYLIGAVLCGAAQSMSQVVYLPSDDFYFLYKGYVVGALVGGVAVENTGWRSVFWMAYI